MRLQTLTLQSIRARPVVLKLKRPVVARIATLTDWPSILIDLYRGRDRTRVPRAIYPQIDALSHSRHSRSRRDAQGAPCRSDRILRSGSQVAALRWLRRHVDDRGRRRRHGGLGGLWQGGWGAPLC